MSKRDGGQAFPLPVGSAELAHDDGTTEVKWNHAHGGMTLRQWYAGQALPAVVTIQHSVACTMGEAATEAFQWADAMLAAEAAEEKS